MIIPQFTQQQIAKMIERKALEAKARQERAIVERLKFIGEQFIVDARTNGSYNDITGNLRNSIGYIILDFGKIVAEGYADDAGTEEGVRKAKAFLRKIANRYPNSICLICCAGMNYSLAVESKGKDVITGSYFQTTARLKRAFQKFNSLKTSI